VRSSKPLRNTSKRTDLDGPRRAFARPPCRRIEAGFLVVGFSLIFLGELLDLLVY
jgi:hypothetical protein